MLRTFLLMVGVLLWALPTWSAAWQKGCQSGAAFTVTAVGVGGFVCYEPTSNSDDSTVLDVQACENFDVLVYADLDGDGTGGTAQTHAIQHCPSGNTAAGTDTVAEQDNACVTFTTGGSHTGTGETLGAAASWVKIQAGGTFAGDPRVIVRCNGALR